MFGCIGYAHIPSQERQKFDEKGENFIFIGYSDESKGYHLLNPNTKKFVTSRDAIFYEMATWEWEDNLQQTTNFELPELEKTQENTSSLQSPDLVQTPIHVTTPSRSPSTSSTSPYSYDSDIHPRKLRSLSDVYQSCEFAFFACEPQTFEDALKENVWTKAMDEEIASIERNYSWELVNLPNGRNVIDLKWIYKTKCNEDGSI